MAYSDYFETVNEVYIAYYQRPADPGGLYYWAQRLNAVQGNLTEIIDAFANSEESLRLYGPINSDTIDDVIDDIYFALFNRAPDEAGKAFYVNGFNDGDFTPGSIVLDILNGAQGNDLLAIENKLEYANFFIQVLDPDGDFIGPYAYDYEISDEQEARDLLAEITYDPASRKTLNMVEEDVIQYIADMEDTVPPVITSDQIFSNEENQAAETVLAVLDAHDNPGGTGIVHYNITGGNDNGYFAINDEGEITLTLAGADSAANDFEAEPNQFVLTITATDAAGNTSTETDVTIHVLDVDAVAPTIVDNQTFDYLENQASGAVLAILNAADNPGGTGIASFKITAGNGNGYFGINNKGEIFLTDAGASAAANDFEITPNSFSMEVTATDKAGNTSTAAHVTLNEQNIVDEIAPVVNSAQTYSYLENQVAGTILGTVDATDNEGGSGVAGFIITAGNAGGYFTINNAGQILLTEAGSQGAANDFETGNNQFILSVAAIDAAGNASAPAAVTLNVVNIEDESIPVIPAGQSFAFGENQPAEGVLGTILVVDSDSDTASFVITEGNADGYFVINDAGEISLTPAGLVSAANDFETAPNAYMLTVTATDPSGNVSAPVAVGLTVTNTDDESPVIAGSQTFGYAENQVASAVLGVVAVSDADSAATAGFAITDGNDGGLFAVNDAGEITLTAAGLLSAANDFETAPNAYTLTVTATDPSGNVSAPVAVTLNVTDEDEQDPSIPAGQVLAYLENRGEGALLGTVDADDNIGVTDFMITDGNDNGYFTINSQGQIVLTAAAIASPANDFETAPNSFIVEVTALDAAGNSFASDIELQVTNIEDETPPVITAGQIFSYAENQAPGTDIGIDVAASDAGGSGLASFAIVSGDQDAYFTINNTGEISLTQAGIQSAANDFETLPNSFTLGLTATDVAGNTSSPVNVVVSVTNIVDEIAPALTGTTPLDNAGNVAPGINIVLNFNENVKAGNGNIRIMQAGQPVASIPVTDAQVTFNGSSVTVNPTADLPASAALYVLIDAGAITDLADNPYLGISNAEVFNFTTTDGVAPVIPIGQAFAYNENRTAGAVLGTVAATDNVGVTGFAIASGNTSSYFAINNQGQLALTAAGAAAGAASNDFETTPNTFTIGITAVDAAGNTSPAINVDLNLNDLDDMAPVVSGNQAFSYNENQAVGAVLGTVAATDNVGVTGFAIASGNTNNYFAINNQGLLTLTAAGAAAGAASNDYETGLNVFSLGITAVDAAGNTSPAVTVSLNVNDVNDGPDATPPVVPANQVFSYNENQAAGAVLGTVAATDNVGVTGFAIASGNTSNYFAINNQGQLTLTAAGAAAGAASNDYETGLNAFQLGITARDAVGNNSPAVTVSLNVNNVVEPGEANVFSGADMDGNGNVNDTITATNGEVDIFIFEYAGFNPASATFIGHAGAFGRDIINNFDVNQDKIVFRDSNGDGYNVTTQNAFGAGAFCGEKDGNGQIQLIPANPLQDIDAAIVLTGIDGGAAILIQGIQDLVTAGVDFEFTVA
jgi:hypothetical protein